MDERQQQIQVGAGLQESRLNTEFIGWLEKYGTWILTIILVVVASYVGYSKYNEYRERALDEAFAQYAAAVGNPGPDGILTGRPDNILKVGAEHGSFGSIGFLSKLDAAEIYLGCVRRGLLPGTDLANIKPEDEITVEKSAELLGSARSLFAEVESATAGKQALRPLHFRARFGAAITEISAGEIGKGRQMLESLEKLAKEEGMLEFAAEVSRRAGALPAAVLSMRELPSDAELPALPGSDPSQQQLDVLGNSPELQVDRMPPGWVPPGVDPNAPPPGAIPLPIPQNAGQPAQTPPAEPVAPAPSSGEPAKPDEPKTP